MITISAFLRKLPHLIALAVLATNLTMARAQSGTPYGPVTPISVSGGGTLYWSGAILTDIPCSYYGGVPAGSYSEVVYDDFYYKPSGGSAIAATSGSGSYATGGSLIYNAPNSPLGGGDPCPPNGPVSGTYNPFTLYFPNGSSHYLVSFSMYGVSGGVGTGSATLTYP
ncbi:MAG: hypothetical protein ABR956_14250 [Terracidiphilus sp.]|jgi:hypothetical protein